VFCAQTQRGIKTASEWQGKSIGYNQTGPVVDTVIFLFLRDDRTKRRVTMDCRRIPSILPKWFLSSKDWPDTMYPCSIRSYCSTSLMHTDNCLELHAEIMQQTGEAERFMQWKRNNILSRFLLVWAPSRGQCLYKAMHLMLTWQLCDIKHLYLVRVPLLIHSSL